MRNHVLLYINGEPVRVAGDDAFLSLSDFLRRRQHLTGTKVVCAEGDCGSCSVLIGRVIGDAMKYAAFTSCIQRVFQLDGAHVVTVEGLNDGDALDPIQQSMVTCHGAQCGFCTPGFVVALHGMANDRAAKGGEGPTRDNACRALVGNLCRCTGYDAILRAAVEADYAAITPLDTKYASPAMRDDLRDAAGEDVLLETVSRRVYKPATLAQALAFRAEHPKAAIVSGGTDWGVLINKRVREITTVLALGDVRSLSGIDFDDSSIRVGATATLAELERVTLDALPAFGEFLSWFGSPPIKAAATLAGNVATGSPIGDSLPALLVLSAEIELASDHSHSRLREGAGGRGSEDHDANRLPTETSAVPLTNAPPPGPLPQAGGGVRRIGLTDFYTGYRTNVMRPDELITAIHIPRLRDGETLKLYKVSKRKDLDISSVSAAIFLRIEQDVITDARIALGGVGPTVKRFEDAEAALRGGPIALERFGAAAAIVRRDVTPISDVRGSAAYRRTLAGNLIVKCFHELGLPAIATQSDQQNGAVR